MDKLEITYLLNSGFFVRLGDVGIVFDDYQDPTGAVDAALPELSELYIFASHAHFDHFNPAIRRYEGNAKWFFLSSDIRLLPAAKQMPESKTIWLDTYDSYEDNGICVTSYDSTDAGTSFLVEKNGWHIFHAGDFNWWHWEGDTEENNGFARNGFKKQMKRLEGLEADVAFFPVDGRLGAAQPYGAKEFCARTETKALVTMHSVGYPRWKPSDDFFLPGKEIPVWSPVESGERRLLIPGGGFTE